MARTLRVAVLECDTPIDPVRERYGSYGNLFQTLLETGFETLGAAVELDVTKWDAVAASRFPDPEETDALVLTGSSTSTSLHVRGMVLISRRTQCL
jgi:hypothetical protein